MKILKDLFIRDIEASFYRENFFVSAVASILAIRVFLKFAHYPQLGAGDLHIAHMLWGGFFMVIAIIILLSFLNSEAAVVASILAGIGFGTFIDELGKFVTSDNNYFFKPTVSLIYIIFVLLYLISKFIPRYQKISEKEYLVNSIELMKKSAGSDFDAEEARRAREYLKKCDPKDPIVVSLQQLLSKIEVTPSKSPGLFSRVKHILRSWYFALAGSGLVLNSIIIFLALQTLRTFFQSVWYFTIRPELPFDQWGQLYSSVLAGIFVLIGLWALRFSRVEAYRFFRIAMLITILLTEFFAFMRSQWYELIGLAANLFILVVINYAMYLEKEKK
jgi:hypothetical protein